MTEIGNLRDQQAEFTRNKLMEAAKRVLDTHSLDEFSIQKVAEEAGVSHRTIYRYYPSRQELLDAFTEWLEDTIAPEKPAPPQNLDDLTRASRQVFDRFDEFAPYFRASLLLSSRGEPIEPTSRSERDQRFRTLLAEVTDPLDEQQARQVYALIRHLLGIRTWQEFHDRFELRDGEAGEAAAWAVDVLIDALRSGSAPGQRGTAKD